MGLQISKEATRVRIEHAQQLAIDEHNRLQDETRIRQEHAQALALAGTYQRIEDAKELLRKEQCRKGREILDKLESERRVKAKAKAMSKRR